MRSARTEQVHSLQTAIIFSLQQAAIRRRGSVQRAVPDGQRTRPRFNGAFITKFPLNRCPRVSHGFSQTRIGQALVDSLCNAFR